MQEKWLIRLKDADCDKEYDDLIAAYYTENPKQQLETFYFCKEHDINLNLPNNSEEKSDSYKDKEAGSIYDIEIGFGSRDTYCYIDIWLENIY